MFHNQKSLSELEEESEQLDAEISVARKKAMLAQLKTKGGQGFWKKFSTNGKQSGISWSGITNWLRTH